MQYYYSASAAGFFRSDIHGSDMPADAVPVTEQEHRTLMDQQSAGKVISAGADGGPVAQAPVITAEDVAEQVRMQRDGLLLDCDWTQLPDAPLSIEQRAEWSAYRQALRDLPQTFAADLTAVVWPAAPATT